MPLVFVNVYDAAVCALALYIHNKKQKTSRVSFLMCGVSCGYGIPEKLIQNFYRCNDLYMLFIQSDKSIWPIVLCLIYKLFLSNSLR